VIGSGGKLAKAYATKGRKGSVRATHVCEIGRDYESLSWPNPRTLGATMVKLILIALFALPLAACGGLGATERYHDNGWRHGGGYYYHQDHWDHRHRDW
jgi:hypothetical protein